MNFKRILVPLLFVISLQCLGQDTLYVVEEIKLIGNRITKSFVIERELAFKPGDSLSVNDIYASIEASKQSLLNTRLFNFVTINFTLEGNRTNIFVSLIERWYIWPIPLFEIGDRNLNEWWETKNFTRTNYGLYILNENFRGRRESLRFRIRMGYQEQYAVRYYVPYLNKSKNLGLKFILGYSRNHELNYGSFNNKRLFFRQEDYLRKELFSSLTLNYRKKLFNQHSVTVGYSNLWVSDSLVIVSDGFTPGNQTRLDNIRLSYLFKHDRRDLKVYPLKGFYFDFLATKIGMGVFNNNVNILNIESVIKHFVKLGNRIYFAQSLSGKYSVLDDPTYYFQRGLGYLNNFIRGYEYEVMDGQHFGLFKSNIKYQLVKPKMAETSLIKSEQFAKYHYSAYLNLFFDAGYSSDRLHANENLLTNKLQYGVGIGLDLVSYYDAAIRFELTVNKQQNTGFFIHFLSPI